MKKCKKFISSVLAITIAVTTLFSSGSVVSGEAVSKAEISVNNLTVEYVENPQGIDVTAPRFGWKLTSNQIGAYQQSYQIVVKDVDGALAWDSGVVNSDDSISVKYASQTPLSPETDYVYTVTVWDNYGNQASADSRFSTGVNGWGDAEWISPGETDYKLAYLRTEATLQNETVKTAKLYMASLGIYKAYINGEVVKGEYESAFDPGWVNYNDYINYQTFDVTSYITSNQIALSAELGRGWYKGGISANGYRDLLGGDTEGRLDLALLGKLVVEYADGTKDVITTNEDWICNQNGPVYNHDFYSSGSFDPDADPFVDGVTYGGEKYDANNELTGWLLPDYAPSSDWYDVNIVTYDGELVSSNSSATAYYNEKNDQYPQPATSYIYKDINQSVADGGTSELLYGEVIVDRYVDLGQEEVTLQPGERLIIDLGQNISGVLETSMEADKDAIVVFSHAEMLNDGKANPNSTSGGSQGARSKGTIYTANLRGEKTAVYTFGDNTEVTYRPDFTYFGFQYVQITVTKPVTFKNIVGKPITSALKQTGDIETNNQNLNKLFSNVLWSQMDNFLSIPTDCPQRNERAGWAGDIQLFAGTGTFNYDSVAFLENYVKISNNQAANNNDLYTAVMPAQQGFGTNVSSGWSDVGVCLPWVLYQQTGDVSIISDSFDQMDRYMDAIGDYGQGYNTTWYGDWVALQGCSTSYLNLMYRAYDAQLMAKMAEAIGDAAKVQKYQDMFEDTKEYYFNKYVSPEGDILSASADTVQGSSQYISSFVDNSQTAIAWAIKLGFYRDEAHKEYILSKLLESIKNENSLIRPGYAEDTLAVGFLGLNVILPSLSSAGATDYAYKLLLQDQFPSWLYSVEQGATSIWERWNSYSKEDSFLAPGMNSFNHFSFGACLEWMYQEMAGISRDEQNPGFKHTNLAPTIDPSNGINYVSASYDSYYGVIESGWTSDASAMTSYNAVVPANTTATLYLPVSSNYEVKSLPEGVTYLGMTEYNGSNTAVFELVSGGFNFEMADDEITVSVAGGYVSSGTSAYHDLLGKTIADAQAAMDTDEYENMIDSRKAEYEAVLEEAIALYNNANATEDELFNMFLKVSDMMNNMGFQKGDKTILLRLIQACDLYNLDLYTPVTVEALEQALSEARVTYLDGDAMQGDVDDAVEALRTAMNGLRYRANKDALQQAINKAQGLNLALYTNESIIISDFANVLENAIAVYDDPNVDQQEVDDTTKAMNNAIDLLVPLSDDGSEKGSDGSGTSSTSSEASGKTSETSSTASKTSNTKSSNTTAKTGDTLLVPIVLVLLLSAVAVAYSRKKRR